MSNTSINPVKIVQIEVIYENGVRIVVDEQKAPKIGKIFFDAIHKDNIDFKIIEPGDKNKKVKGKIADFFKL